MGMTIEERNDLIDQMLVDYKICHDKHFPDKKPLADDDWVNTVSEMDAVANKYKDTNIVSLSNKICMAFLDDIELVDKLWKEKIQKQHAT